MINNKKKIWFVTELYWPSLTSTGFIFTHIAEGIVERHDISVLTGPPSYEEGGRNYKLNEIHNGVSISRMKIPHLGKNNFFMRLIRLFLVTWRLLFNSIKQIENDAVVILVTTPFTSVFIGALLKRLKKGTRTIMVVHDIYPDNMVVAGVIKKNGLIHMALGKIFSSALAKMDEIVVLGRDMQEVLVQKGHSNIRIIENWAEPSVLCEPKPLEIMQGRVNTVFLFAGNIGRLQGIEQLLEAIELAACEKARFVFAGGGAMQNRVVLRSKTLPQNQLKYIGRYDRSEQLAILSSCDVGVVSLDKGMFGLGVPSKAYNIMAAGKPILYIGDPDSEIHLKLKDDDCGWFADSSSIDSIVSAIKDICSTSNAELLKKAQNSYRLGSEVYTEESAILAYKNMIAELPQ